MKKVSPINRALKTERNTEDGAGPRRRGSKNRANRAHLSAVESPEHQSHDEATAPPASREELRGLFNDYHAREQTQQYFYLEERLRDAISELTAKVSSQELQIQSLQNAVDSERRLSQSAVANLKDLFDGNYRVMSDISDKYEDSHQAFENDKANFDRRLDFIQQESFESTSQLRTAIIQSQDEDRSKLAESLRALADSVDRKPGG